MVGGGEVINLQRHKSAGSGRAATWRGEEEREVAGVEVEQVKQVEQEDRREGQGLGWESLSLFSRASSMSLIGSVNIYSSIFMKREKQDDGYCSGL